MQSTMPVKAEIIPGENVGSEARNPVEETQMKAIVQEEYGGPEVLELREVERPTPGEGEVLVKMRAASVPADEWHLMRGLPYAARMESGLTRPKRKVPGLNLAGVVEAVGSGVTRFEPGDAVFGWCTGAFAEFVSVSEDSLVLKPDGIAFEEAASLPISGFTAMQGLRDQGELKEGQHVLINGASGGVGSLAVQIAKAMGAEVTGVSSTRNLERVRSLGADHVIDYTQEDFTDHKRRYDVILDLAASHSLKETRKALKRTGTLVMVGSSNITTLKGRARWFKGTERWIAGLFLSLFSGQKLRPLIHEDRQEDLLELAKMVEDGKLQTLVSKTFPLSQTADAIRLTEGKHGPGTVVVTPDVNP